MMVGWNSDGPNTREHKRRVGLKGEWKRADQDLRKLRKEIERLEMDLHADPNRLGTERLLIGLRDQEARLAQKLDDIVAQAKRAWVD